MKNIKRVNNIAGQKFGRLKAIGIDESKQTRKTYWICECDCGNMISVRSDALKCGRTKSCGCYKQESDRKNVTNVPAYKKYLEQGQKVGGTRLYSIWQGMKARCYNPNNTRYNSYGGRGIVICDEWKDDYMAFLKWAMDNGYSDELTIDRKNVNGNYEPGNCQWATSAMQSNNRRSNIDITIGKTTKTLKEWCLVFGLSYGTIRARYKRNENITLDELFKI